MGANTNHQAMIPVWLDCDPGHDDAFAIVFAAMHPLLKMLGVSTVHGNASLARTTANAASVLEAIDRTDILVYPGSAKPFCRKAVHASNIHGSSGLDGTDLLPEPTVPPISSVPAILAMRKTLLAEPAGTPWLVATGALTNAALLFATFPELVSHVKGLSIMGGAIGNGFTDAPMGTVRNDELGEDVPRSGNVTHFAEFNIYCDPEAAKSIFSNPELARKTTLVPLDVTHQVLATESVQNMVLHGAPKASSRPMAKQPSVLRRMLHDLLIFFAHTYAEVFNITAGPPLHDAVAVAVLLHNHATQSIQFIYGPDQIGKEERFDVEIITVGEHSPHAAEQGRVGATVVRLVDIGNVGVRIPRGLDVEAFWKVMGECIARAEDLVARKETR